MAISVRPIIGLEIHVQLRTRTKMFCACPVRFEAPPNSCTCPVCLGHPGTLPVINRRAYELAVLTGLALNCRIAAFTKWDRKSYYYPDMPKNYQISQYDLPLAAQGWLDVAAADGARRVRIRRAHLEEDAGKNIHDAGDRTLVDLNRAGTPLLEIVTEPDLTSADEAYAFCTELHRLVTYLGVSEGNMKKGQMRFEPNVNVHIVTDGDEYRTPISEIKNLNSFRAVRDAIEYEVSRQAETWQRDPGYVFGAAANENRGWNAERLATEFQRGKEAAHDYRYFPDPDLVPALLQEDALHALRAGLPELPQARRRRWEASAGVPADAAEIIVADLATADLFDEVLEAGVHAELAAKQFANVWQALANARGQTVAGLGVSARRVAALAKAVEDGTVNKTAAQVLAEAMLTRDEDPQRLAEELGLTQVRDMAATEAWVDAVFAAHQQAVKDARAHPKKAKAAAGFLRGQVMKQSGGKADPKLVGELIQRRLDSQ
jgi:aspartyl-tRNA(Asn)/glutamyl-tRNA(Gln) amidotransferase subunit B